MSFQSQEVKGQGHKTR